MIDVNHDGKMDCEDKNCNGVCDSAGHSHGSAGGLDINGDGLVDCEDKNGNGVCDTPGHGVDYHPYAKLEPVEPPVTAAGLAACKVDQDMLMSLEYEPPVTAAGLAACKVDQDMLFDLEYEPPVTEAGL